MIWDPIDKGVGDGDIMVAKEPVPRITGPSTSGVLRKRVAAERTESIEERKSKKPKGLLGGGLGGEPAAPEVFMQWIRAHNDKRRCVDLFNHLDQLGLTVLDSKRSPGSWPLRCLGDPEAISIKVNSNEKASEKPHSGSVSRASGREKLVESSTRSSKRGLHHSEIPSLQDGRFVSDGIVKFVFKQYSDELRQKEIHDAVIVDVNTSLFLSRGHTTGAQKLCSNRLVIFPLNNYEESDHDRAGWSTLVLDKWTKHGPRFIHYDSWDRANLPLARHLVDVLNPFVPWGTNFCEVDAPQQVDPSDSALYTIAITRSICRWCAKSSVSNEDCWSNVLWTEVSTKTIERLRKSLHRGLIGHQRVDGGNVPITSTSMQPEASDGSGKKGLCPNEVASLQAGMFVSDAVVNFVFRQYSEELWRSGIRDVILADANTSFLWRYGDTTGALESCSNRLVIFPVNNNVDLECAGGTHWSLLVLDKWTELGPRFIHYDSYGASNSPFARRYAVVLQPFVPASTYFIEADTPQQENLFDCGIYIIAIARSICPWCMGASLSDEEDWSQTLRREVNAETTANLRTLLHLELQEHLQKPNKPM
ncbi:hypothetical protein HU200_039740 [Digitaria exilis]|uniref:Ubiquitin-like protease family profile domain-containing protein n=1 Tax=Digitaria exilis TaxID=1010633 RepID=A0A835B726_9POAL|nr:hypothetical protein HU200_039740 [Digitaria exilis]